MENSYKFQKKRQPSRKWARNCRKENTQHSPFSVTREVQIKSTMLYCITLPPAPVAHRKADGITGECGRGSRSWLCWGVGTAAANWLSHFHIHSSWPHTSQLWTYYVTPQQPLKTHSNKHYRSIKLKNFKLSSNPREEGEKRKKTRNETVGTQTENYK